MRIIALDLGEKTLGICISDQKKIIPIPVENFQFPGHNFKKAAQHLKNLVDKFKDVELIIIGYPLKTNGEKTVASKNVDLFLEEFEKINKPQKIIIKKIDERFSTKRGIELLKKKYKSDKEIEKNKDLAAAYVMLYDFLSS